MVEAEEEEEEAVVEVTSRTNSVSLNLDEPQMSEVT